MSKRFDWDAINRRTKAAQHNPTAADVDRGWRKRIKAQQDADKLKRLADSKEEQAKYEKQQEAHRRKYFHMVQRIRRERQNQGR